MSDAIARVAGTRPVLSLVVDRSVCRLPLSEAIRAAAASGVDWIQLRERELDAAPLIALVREVGEIARKENPAVRLIINRRIDVALASGTDGVHLGFDALSPTVARSLLGDEPLIGVSTHAPDEVDQAALEGADYVHLAPIFAPKSKAATRDALGLDALRDASRHGIPVIAQGGIDESNTQAVLQAGAAGVAVTGAILMSDDPGEQTARLRAALDEGI